MNFLPLLAAVTKYSGAGEGSQYLKHLMDPLLMVLAIIPLAVGAFVWAKASSRKRRHQKRHSHRITAEESQAMVESWKTMRGSRHRRKRHGQRESQNPTLAETGGLPPRRTESPAAQATDLPPPPATVPPRPSSGTVPPNPPIGWE